MSIKLIILKSGENIISDVKELVSEENVVAYFLDNPHKVECEKKIVFIQNIENPEGEVELTISPWVILSKDSRIPIKSDWIVTMVDPIPFLQEMYEDKINGKS